MNNLVFYLVGFLLGVAFEFGLIYISTKRNVIGKIHTTYENGECTKCVFELNGDDVMDDKENYRFVIFKVDNGKR